MLYNYIRGEKKFQVANKKYWILQQKLTKQARKPRSYASPKLCPLTDSLTGVKCRATSVATNLYCRFWTFKQGFLSMKMLQKGHFRVQGMFFSTIVLRKIKTRHTFKEALLNPPPFWKCYENSSVLVTPAVPISGDTFHSDNLPRETINLVLFKIRKYSTSVTISGQNDNLFKSTINMFVQTCAHG